jgi:hypothetical protein
MVQKSEQKPLIQLIVNISLNQNHQFFKLITKPQNRFNILDKNLSFQARKLKPATSWPISSLRLVQRHGKVSESDANDVGHVFVAETTAAN